jgi:urease accessory protein
MKPRREAHPEAIGPGLVATVRPPVSAALRLLQLASPALPIGGYSYSSGLEPAIESGRVTDAESAFEWIDDAMSLVIGRFDAPLLAAALQACRDDDHSRLADLNRLALAARETAELRLESEQMGYSLMQWVIQVPGMGAQSPAPAMPVSAVVAWAMAAWRLNLQPADAVTGFVWSFAENQVMVLIKTMPIGQIQAQRVLLRLGKQIGRVVEAALRLPPTEWSNAAPGLAIASMHHETQYSRLFRS